MPESIFAVPRDPDTTSVNDADQEPEKSRHAAVITFGLVGINVVVFLAGAIANPNWLSHPDIQQLIRWGANFGPLTLHGQLWRLFTSCFLHIGVLHILMNMIILLQVGMFAEAVFGHIRFLTIYILAGLGGSMASALGHPPLVAAGASGAIFGIYGAILAFLLMQRKTFPTSAAMSVAKGAGVFIVYNLAYSIANPNIDVRAHIGGLIAGFLVALPLSTPIVPGVQPVHLTRIAFVTLVAVAAGWLVLRFQPGQISPKDELTLAIVSGNNFLVGKEDRIIYSGSATEGDARKLAAALKPTGFFAGKGAVLLLSKQPSGTAVSIITPDKDPAKPGDGGAAQPDLGPHLVPNAWDDPNYLARARAVGILVAPSIGGPPITLRLLTKDGVFEKEIRIEEHQVTIGQRDMIWYSDPATLSDAQSLGDAFRKIGFFHDVGALAILSKQNGGFDISIVVKDGAWDNLNVTTSFRKLAQQLSQRLNQPVRIHLIDRSATVRKDI